MLPVRENPAAPRVEPAAWWRSGFSHALLWCSIAGLIAACGLRWLAESSTDLPPLPELAREAHDFYQPLLRGETPAENLGLSQAPGARAWTAMWLRENGHWDARVLSLANLALLTIGATTLFAMLARGLPGRWLIGLGLATIALVVLVPVVPRSSVNAAGPGLLLAGSMLQLALMTRPRHWSRALGFVFGALNLAVATTGIASSLALVLWEFLSRRSEPQPARSRGSVQASLVLNSLLVVAGVVLAVVRSAREISSAGFFQSLEFLLAWPLECPGWAFVIWAPAVICLIQAWRCPSETHRSSLSLLALWALAQVAVLAASRVTSSDHASVLLVAGVIVNAACFSIFPSTGWKGAARNQVLLWLWGIAIADALLYGGLRNNRPTAGPSMEDSVTALLRGVAAGGDPAALRATGSVSETDGRELARVFSDPALRRVLPGSIRPPLALEPMARGNPSGFKKEGTPVISGRDELPAWGTWSAAAGGAATGEFVSAPLESQAAFVQIRIAGELRPPGTSLVLRRANGTELAPLEGAFNAESRWKRVNFATPVGPFQIVARDASPTAWLALTAPQEVGRLTWLAGKLVRTWPWWLAVGIVAGGVGVVLEWRQVTRPNPIHVRSFAPDIVWPVVPWMVLVAYAVFFSNHIDGTAGPNDSGGYLNSAKLLVEGHVTAAPRMIFGPAAGETDITPYLPTTFSATHDGRMAPEYPVGFPLEIWAAAKLTSLEIAVPALTLSQLVLGVLFTYWLARAMGLPRGWDWLAAGIVGLSSVYLFQALQPQSDGPALVWVTAAVYWAWTSREKPWHAGLAGFATALAVMIRPSNLLCVAPIMICLAGRWRQIARWALAGIPAAAWLLWYNHVLYANAFTTGYGDVRDSFALHFATLTWKSYARWLPVMFTPVVVLAWFAPFLRAIPGRVRAVLAVWAAAFLGFYTFYWCTYDNWYNMRFVLPAAPALVILGLWVVRWLAERVGLALFSSEATWRTVLPSTVLVVGLLGMSIVDTRDREVVYWMHANRNYAVACEWARTHFPANAVVFAKPISGSLTYYTDFIVVRSDHEKAQSLEFFQRIARSGHPIFAVTSHWEQKGFKWGAGRGDGYPNLPGNWDRLASFSDGEILAWAWHPPGPKP